MNRNFILQKFPFLEDDFDALTDYQLFSKMVAYMRKVSKQCDAFQKQLDDYENYFKNLDVQEEIDNKLEEMSQSGELDSIIAQFLNTNIEYVFDTMSDLTSSEALINGSHAKTLGYLAKGDGGASNYYIRTKTNDDTADGCTIIDLQNNLVGIFEPDNSILNVHQFGIFGDGETDVTTKLNKAFNYDCYIPAGTYIISDTININNHLIYGDGIDITIIKLADGAGLSGYSPIYAYQKSTINIKKITFDGNKDEQTNGYTFLSLFDSTDIVVENCKFIDTFTGMLKLNDSNRVKVLNCIFKNSTGVSGATAPAIFANPVNNLIVNGCECENIGDHFLYLTSDDENKYSKNIIVKNCILNSCGADGLTAGSALCVYANSQDVLIDNCIIKSNRSAIFVGKHGDYTFTPKNVMITNCLVDTTTLTAISIEGVSSDKVDNVKISNCTVRNATQTAINTHYATNVDIDSCNLYDNNAGITSGYTDYLGIYNNRIYDNATSGVLIGTSARDCNYVNIYNTLIYGVDGQTNGLYVNVGNYIKVYNCDVYGNTNNIVQGSATNVSYIDMVDKNSTNTTIPSITFTNRVPTAGTYKTGDIVIFNTGSDTNVCAVCTAGGTPGTWQLFG